ncbi:MAG: ChaN family lipoprotein [Desulfurococcales archaeon]|nr:ChaN family lipoprotein [Desulfurococcales archaeon]
MGRFYSIDREITVKPGKIPVTLTPSVIFFGELHENKDVVEGELSILRSLHELSNKKKLKLVIGMEHFNVNQQKILDMFLGGRISWESFVDKYSKGPEGFNLDYYKPVLLYAKKHELPVKGLMPPRDEAKRIVREGLKPCLLEKYGLKASDIKTYPREYYKRFAQLIPQEGPMSVFGVESLVLAQSYKDEVMSLSIAEELNSGIDLVYAIMGSGHCEHIGTVPDRVGKYFQYPFRKLIITTREITWGELPLALVRTMKNDMFIIADYVYII